MQSLHVVTICSTDYIFHMNIYLHCEEELPVCEMQLCDCERLNALKWQMLRLKMEIYPKRTLATPNYSVSKLYFKHFPDILT